MLSSPYWDEFNGVCTKHHLPMIPCPACVSQRDEDMVETKSESDAMFEEDQAHFSYEERFGRRQSLFMHLSGTVRDPTYVGALNKGPYTIIPINDGFCTISGEGNETVLSLSQGAKFLRGV